MKQKVLALMAAAVIGITSVPMAGLNVFAEEAANQKPAVTEENEPVNVNMTPSGPAISVEPKSYSFSIAPYDTIQLDSTGISGWSSSNSYVASVTQSGLVTAWHYGTAVITAVDQPVTYYVSVDHGFPEHYWHGGWYRWYDHPYWHHHKPAPEPPVKVEKVYVPVAAKPAPAVKPTTNKGVGRFYNPKTGEHLYTTSGAEARSLYDAGWKHEGTAWISPAAGEPVYRLYNPKNGDHMLTISSVERDTLIAHGWNYESIAFQSGGSTPVFRLYNPDAAKGKHAFTTSSSERDRMVANGWISEGIGWYAVK